MTVNLVPQTDVTDQFVEHPAAIAINNWFSGGRYRVLHYTDQSSRGFVQAVVTVETKTDFQHELHFVRVFGPATYDPANLMLSVDNQILINQV